MFNKDFQINADAIFLSDAHDNANKKHFLNFLKALKNGDYALPSQIFLLGDMFDFLSITTYSQQFYSEYISILNELSTKTQIFYFEGNHDFNLAQILPNCKVFGIEKQPVRFEFSGLSVDIAHGDIFLPFITQKALKILRNKMLLGFLNFLDCLLKYKISKVILRSQMHKKLDFKIENFKDKISLRLKKFSADVVLEGHWHQNQSFEIENKFYINLPSFACEQSFFMIQFSDFKIQILKRSLNV